MRIRFRHPQGIATLSNVDENADLAALKRQIAEEISLPAGKVIKGDPALRIVFMTNSIVLTVLCSIGRVPS